MERCVLKIYFSLHINIYVYIFIDVYMHLFIFKIFLQGNLKFTSSSLQQRLYGKRQNNTNQSSSPNRYIIYVQIYLIIFQILKNNLI